MQKILAGYTDCNILDDILSDNNMQLESADFDFQTPTTKHKTLTSSINYFTQVQKFEAFMLLNTDLPNKTAIAIAKELAKAIDKNSVSDIKYLKNKYGHTKEFAQAKDLLNKKCKEIWNVFESKKQNISPPKEAMKALGITNCPSIEFLLKDSLLFFEKDNGTTTVDIISSILNNKNLYYSFDDIYIFLKTFIRQKHINLNHKSIEYFIIQTNCSPNKLTELNINNKEIHQVLKNFAISKRIKYTLKVFFLQYFKK